jgi:hypothetical protein
MMGRVLQTFYEVEELSPLELERFAWLNPAIPRVRVTHDRDRLRKNNLEDFAGKRVILLVRDLRDTVVSTYFSRIHRTPPYTGTLHEFLYESTHSFGSMLEFYNLWAKHREVLKELMLVRYEDLRQDPAGRLREVMDFIGVKTVPPELIHEAVEFASFENMRKLEAEDAFGSFRLRPGDRNAPDSYKTRRGVVGGYADYFCEQDIEYMNRRIARELDPFYGYETMDKRRMTEDGGRRTGDDGGWETGDGGRRTKDGGRRTAEDESGYSFL